MAPWRRRPAMEFGWNLVDRESSWKVGLKSRITTKQEFNFIRSPQLQSHTLFLYPVFSPSPAFSRLPITFKYLHLHFHPHSPLHLLNSYQRICGNIQGGSEEAVPFHGDCTLPKRLMREFNVSYKALGTAEYETVREKLSQVARSRVPFEEFAELVDGRKVYLHGGYAYVAMNQVVSLVVAQFRSNLSECFGKMGIYHSGSRKDRLTPIVESLSTAYVGHDYTQPHEFAVISLKDIDQIAKSSFPLCMKHLFDRLRDDHHLKHGGRMQLGLFLKGAGLNLDAALAFWKAEFSKKIGSERFDKEYAYNIRHNYGKEGKKTDYTPYACQKIISSTPGNGDHHGCPYRHFSENNLRAALGKMGVGGRALEDILDKAKNRHYQLACTMTFEAIHETSCDSGVNHPNQYFIESQKVLKSKQQTLASSTTESME